MRDGASVLRDGLAALRRRASHELRSLPDELRRPGGRPFPVVLSDRLVRLTADVRRADDPSALAELRRPLEQHGPT